MEVKTPHLKFKVFAHLLFSALLGGLIGFSFGGRMFTIFLCALSATMASVWRLSIQDQKIKNGSEIKNKTI